MALGLAWRSRVLDAAGGRHRTQSAGCPAAAAASRRWRRCVVAAAATQQGAAAAAEPQQRVERVLRYPDGNERRIIYPTTTPSEDAQRASALLAEEGLDEDGFSAWAFSDTELVRGPALSLSRGGGGTARFLACPRSAAGEHPSQTMACACAGRNDDKLERVLTGRCSVHSAGVVVVGGRRVVIHA